MKKISYLRCLFIDLLFWQSKESRITAFINTPVKKTIDKFPDATDRAE